jgi:hypothetical protein
MVLTGTTGAKEMATGTDGDGFKRRVQAQLTTGANGKTA